MLFRIISERVEDRDQKVFFYDNETNQLSTEEGFIYDNGNRNSFPISKPFSPSEPLKKSRRINLLKIQLGLSCNYSCDYCSQRFVPHSEETNKHDVPGFMKKLEVFDFDEQSGLKVEFWGGEPFVYWKTLKPLVAAIKDKFKDWKTPPRISVITNGSLLTDEINDWLEENNFSVAISHDGPNQYVRGPDPFDDPEQKKIILDLYRRLHPKGNISFNAMMSGANMSRREVYEWFADLTGDESVPLGEGGIIDAYDEGGKQNSLLTKQQHFEFRRQSFTDITITNGNFGFMLPIQKIDDFTRDVLTHRSSETVGQKCGMELENVIAVNLHGDVTTCQNLSTVAINSNGEPHYGGNIEDLDNVSISSSTHWRNRKRCVECPVLTLCKGNCMYLDGDLWNVSCENAYSDNIWEFAASLQKITGYVPIFIDNECLPDHRKDIWGTVLEHKEEPKKKVIPIQIVNEKTLVNDIEVFTRSQVKGQ